MNGELIKHGKSELGGGHCAMQSSVFAHSIEGKYHRVCLLDLNSRLRRTRVIGNDNVLFMAVFEVMENIPKS